jgi:hypothetical protein
LFGDLFVAHVEVPKSSFQRPEFKIIAYNSEQPIPLYSVVEK